MARGIKFAASEAYAVVGTLPDGTQVNNAEGLYTYKRHATAARTRCIKAQWRMKEEDRTVFQVVPVALTWHLEAAE